MKTKMCLLMAVFISVTAFSQNYAGRSGMTILFRPTKIYKVETYRGSPYMHNDFRKGNVLQNDTIVFKDVPLRLNAYNNEVEIKNYFTEKDEEAQAVAKSPYIDIQIEDEFYVFVPYSGHTEKNPKGKYFQVLLKGGAIELFKRTDKSFKQAVKHVNPLRGDIKAAFTDEVSYYLVDVQGKLYEIPKKNKDFYAIFLKEGKAVRDYVKKNRLNINKEQDLIEIIKYYNTLFQ